MCVDSSELCYYPNFPWVLPFQHLAESTHFLRETNLCHEMDAKSNGARNTDAGAFTEHCVSRENSVFLREVETHVFFRVSPPRGGKRCFLGRHSAR